MIAVYPGERLYDVFVDVDFLHWHKFVAVFDGAYDRRRGRSGQYLSLTHFHSKASTSFVCSGKPRREKKRSEEVNEVCVLVDKKSLRIYLLARVLCVFARKCVRMGRADCEEHK